MKRATMRFFLTFNVLTFQPLTVFIPEYFFVSRVVGRLKHEYGCIDPGESDGAVSDAPGNKDQACFGQDMRLAPHREFYFTSQPAGIIPVRSRKTDDLVEIMAVLYFNTDRFAAGKSPQYFTTGE